MEKLKEIVEEYLKIYPDEYDRQKEFIEYLNNDNNKEVWNDWNNFNGHMVAGGFIFSKKDKKFLMLYHKDLKMYLHPGGHVDKNETDLLETAKREIFEETGLSDLKMVNLNGNSIIPFDIDTHEIKYNERLNLPKHKHFEFRYLFEIPSITNIKIDLNESSKYVWIDLDEIKHDLKYKNCYKKLEKYVKEDEIINVIKL